MLKHVFTAHPASVDETYLEHAGVALSFSWLMMQGALAGLVHAFLPFLCVKTGSTIISRLNERMVVNRNRHSTASLADTSTAPIPGV